MRRERIIARQVIVVEDEIRNLTPNPSLEGRGTGFLT
jgi:hypothetical protein